MADHPHKKQVLNQQERNQLDTLFGPLTKEERGKAAGKKALKKFRKKSTKEQLKQFGANN